jgi:hypothetical protein
MSSRPSFLLVLALSLAAAACGENDKKLKVTGLEPVRGDSDGGTYVVIKGNRFIADGPRTAKVFFGKQGNFRQGSIVRFASDDRLIVQAPGGNPGEVVDVLVTFEPGGKLTIPNAFTFIDKSDTMPSVNDLDINKDKRVKKQ